MALSIIPASVANLYQSVWIAFEDVRAISVIMLLFSTVRVVGGALLLFTGQPILWIGALFPLTGLGELAAYVWLTSLREGERRVAFGGWRPDMRFWIDSLRTATPLIVVSLVLIVEYQFDVVILSFFRPEAQVGIYSKASMLLTLLLFLTRSYQLAIFPVISRAYENSRQNLPRVYGHSLAYLVGGALLIALLVTALAEPLLNLIYGAGNQEAASILRILVWAFTMSAFNVPNSRLIIAADRQKVIAYFAVMSMSGNLLLSLWLVPRYGGMGTAVARVAAMPLYSIPAFYYVQRYVCALSWRHLLPDDLLSR
jgi:O-antigen/teichoic acid export membrane protein